VYRIIQEWSQIHASKIFLLIVLNEEVQDFVGVHCMPNLMKIDELVQMLEWGVHMA
jgi:hypothetical protein